MEGLLSTGPTPSSLNKISCNNKYKHIILGPLNSTKKIHQIIVQESTERKKKFTLSIYCISMHHKPNFYLQYRDLHNNRIFHISKIPKNNFQNFYEISNNRIYLVLPSRFIILYIKHKLPTACNTIFNLGLL